MKCFQAILAAHSRVRFLISEVSSCVRSHLIQTKWLPSWSWNSTPSGNDGLALRNCWFLHMPSMLKPDRLAFPITVGCLEGEFCTYDWEAVVRGLDNAACVAQSFPHVTFSTQKWIYSHCSHCVRAEAKYRIYFVQHRLISESTSIVFSTTTHCWRQKTFFFLIYKSRGSYLSLCSW